MHHWLTLICRHHGWNEQEMRNQWSGNRVVLYLGGELPNPIEVPSFIPQPGDRLVLATDGVHYMLKPPELLAACRLHPQPLACAEHLVRSALDQGSRDNATCVVLAFDCPPRAKPEPRAGGRWWRFWAKSSR